MAKLACYPPSILAPLEFSKARLWTPTCYQNYWLFRFPKCKTLCKVKEVCIGWHILKGISKEAFISLSVVDLNDSCLLMWIKTQNGKQESYRSLLFNGSLITRHALLPTFWSNLVAKQGDRGAVAEKLKGGHTNLLVKRRSSHFYSHALLDIIVTTIGSGGIKPP